MCLMLAVKKCNILDHIKVAYMIFEIIGRYLIGDMDQFTTTSPILTQRALERSYHFNILFFLLVIYFISLLFLFYFLLYDGMYRLRTYASVNRWLIVNVLWISFS